MLPSLSDPADSYLLGLAALRLLVLPRHLTVGRLEGATALGQLSELAVCPALVLIQLDAPFLPLCDRRRGDVRLGRGDFIRQRLELVAHLLRNE